MVPICIAPVRNTASTISPTEFAEYNIGTYGLCVNVLNIYVLYIQVYSKVLMFLLRILSFWF